MCSSRAGRVNGWTRAAACSPEEQGLLGRATLMSASDASGQRQGDASGYGVCGQLSGASIPNHRDHKQAEAYEHGCQDGACLAPTLEWRVAPPRGELPTDPPSLFPRLGRSTRRLQRRRRRGPRRLSNENVCPLVLRGPGAIRTRRCKLGRSLGARSERPPPVQRNVRE